jgi:putative hydrolase of HD superfamily
MNERFERQLAFIIEADRLKEIQRRSYLISGARVENSAEHSWHLALNALILGEYANTGLDTFRVLRMLLIHDLVEIDAGDTFCYDAAGNATKAAREQAAADRLFGLLPPDQGADLRALWEEFEAGVTPEARFAVAMDRLMPVLHNLRNHGRGWREHVVNAEQVLTRNALIGEGSEKLWAWVKGELDRAFADGLLEPKKEIS